MSHHSWPQVPLHSSQHVLSYPLGSVFVVLSFSEPPCFCILGSPPYLGDTHSGHTSPVLMTCEPGSGVAHTCNPSYLGG
jgi:hypothetical protein